MMKTSTTGRRRVFLLCASCCLPIIIIFTTASFLHSFLPKQHPALPPHLGSEHTISPAAEEHVGNWIFDPSRDHRNYGLSEAQCDAAFPGFYREIERAVAFRKDNDLPRIEEDDVDISWRKGGEIVRLMIYDRQVRNWLRFAL